MIEKYDTSDVELLALKYKDVKLPNPKVDKEVRELSEELGLEKTHEQEEHEEHEENHEHDDHEALDADHENEEHVHEENEDHDHEHDEECGCDHHHHEHDHEEHEHHHEEGEECGCGHHHHHHHKEGEDHGHEHCGCGHDHEGHEHHHHHHHEEEPVEVSTHEDSVIATVRLGSLGRDKQAALVTLRSFMRAVAEETEGLGGMIGHIKFFMKESKGTMFSMTDLEEIQEKPAEGFEYTAEGVCIVLGIEPEQLEEITERHLPEKA